MIMPHYGMSNLKSLVANLLFDLNQSIRLIR